MRQGERSFQCVRASAAHAVDLSVWQMLHAVEILRLSVRGIYVGGGNVVHYSGYQHGLRKGPVEEISLESFRGSHPLWIKSNPSARFEGPNVVWRARSRLGENCYRLLTNNCEHFCEWCLFGEQRSYQVEALRVCHRRAASVAINALMQFVSLLGDARFGHRA